MLSPETPGYHPSRPYLELHPQPITHSYTYVTGTPECLRDALYRNIAPKCEERWRSDLLAEPAINYGRRFLGEACQYLISIVRNLPEFNDDITWETYVLTRQLVHTLESSITSVVVPRYRQGTPREVSRFEAAYSSDIVSTFGHMELFGVNLPLELRRQPLEIAYITLTASTNLAYYTNDTTSDASLESSDRFDRLLAKILRAGDAWGKSDISSGEKLAQIAAALKRPPPKRRRR